MSKSGDFKEYRCVAIKKVPHFRDANASSEGSLTQHGPCHHDGFSYEHFSVDVYANGTIDRETEGYLSATIYTVHLLFDEEFFKNFELLCVFHVLDASGEKRYPKSYVCSSLLPPQDLFRSFIHLRILKRDILLSEPDDLLPDDCLTLHIDMIFRTWFCEPIYDLAVLRVTDFGYQRPDRSFVLEFDSRMGKRLIEESSYFRSMSETPMVEKQRGYGIFESDEFSLFSGVCDILEGAKYLKIASVNCLCRIYDTADKYDIPVAIERCRGLLSTLLREAESSPAIKEHIAEDLPELMELADRCNDVRLKEIVKRFFQGSRGDASDGSGTSDSTRDRSEAEWWLESVGEHCEYFLFARGTPAVENFDFYQ